MRSILVVGLFLSVTSSSARAGDSVSLSKLAVAPEAFEGQVVTVDASMGMLVAQKVLSHCKSKEKAVLLFPPMVAGQPGAMASVQHQACVSTDTALALAEVPLGSPLQVTGTVRVVRSLGTLVALVLDAAAVVAGGSPATPAAP